MHKQTYRGCRFYFYVKHKGFARTAFILDDSNVNYIKLNLLTDIHFSLLEDVGTVLTIKLYCVKMKHSKETIYDLGVLNRDRKRMDPIFSKKILVNDVNHNNRNSISYIFDNFDITFYTNVYQNKIFLSNPYIVIDKGVVDEYINECISNCRFIND
jgi:hypothetical protein